MQLDSSHPLKTPVPSPEAGIELLKAQNEACERLPFTERTQEGALTAFGQALSRRGFSCCFGVLKEDQTRLTLYFFLSSHNRPNRVSQADRALKLESVELPISSPNAFRQVIQTGRTLFLEDQQGSITNLVQSTGATMPAGLFENRENQRTIVTALRPSGILQGVISIAGEGITSAHILYVEALSWQIASTLENMQAMPARNEEEQEAFSGSAGHELSQRQIEQVIQRKAEELAALHAVSLNIIAAQNLPTLLHAITEQATLLLKASSGSLGLYDPRSQEVRIAFSYNTPEDFTGILFERGEGLAGKIVITGKPEIIENYDSWEGQAAAFKQKNLFHTVIGAPMIWQGNITGVLQVYDRKDNGSFTSADLELLTLFANQAAIAIENARLFEAEHFARERAETLREVARTVSSSLELHQVLHAILQGTLNLFPEANNSHIFLYNEEEDRLAFGAALWAQEAQNHPWSEPRPHGLTYTVARSGETIVVPDMRSHPLYVNTPEDWQGAIIGLPLKIGERVVGVMNTSYKKPREIPESEVRIMHLLGDQAAIAIENGRLYEKAETERNHLELLHEMGRELATTLDVNEILHRAVHLTCHTLDGALGEAFLYLPEEKMVCLRAIYDRRRDLDLSTTEINGKLDFRLGVGLTGWVAENKKPANVPDIRQDSRWLQISEIEGDIRSVISAPILVGSQLMGLLAVLHDQEAAFSTEHLVLMEAICQEIGLALSNAIRYQQVQRRLAEITLIQSLGQIFNQRLELQVLLEEVVVQLSERLHYPQVRIFMVEGERLALKASHGPGLIKETYPLDQGIIGSVVQSGHAIFIPDVSQPADDQVGDQASTSELAVPIFQGQSIVGVINIESRLPNQLSAQDRDLLQVLAGQISIALENAVLYERVRGHAENLESIVAQRTAELAELYKLSQEIGYLLSYDELLHLILRRLCSAIGCELVVGYLAVENYQALIIETNQPLEPAVQQEIFNRWKGMMQLESDQPVDMGQTRIEVNQTRRENAGDASIQRIGSFIQAPIRIQGKAVGLLMAIEERADVYGEEQERLITTFANQASTAIERLEAMLAAQQKQMENLVEHVPVGILLFDADFHLVIGNTLGRELLEFLAAGQAGDAMLQLGPYTIRELANRFQEPLPTEITLDGPPRRVFAIQTRRVITDKTQWVLSVREITEERDFQARIQSQERLATVGQLAAGIAHDFNNIMAAILVYTDLLHQDESIQGASKDKLTIIQQQVQRAASLIRQILDFSRRSVMEQSSLDLLPFIKELDKLLGRILPETIRLELSYQPGEYWVNADPTRMQQVFMNLAVNARDAMSDGGVLAFELGHYELAFGTTPPIPYLTPGKWVRISIRDNGAGIPAEIIPHIFDPFFTTKPVGQGTGLGLAQVYGIIKQHDGYIDVTSFPGNGTTFTIYLPALLRPVEPDKPVNASIQFLGNGENVLVVEDNEATREAIQALLEAQHYEVITAMDGIEAIHRYEQAHPSIAFVVSDVIMPRMGGMALYRALRKRWPDVKMLFVTGHPLEIESQTMLEMGNYHWLQKPFSMFEFNQAVRALLKEKPS
jgi:GAF domain-containing protein/ActR/RegA family two-component response regulator